jgi:hypothetical protein
MTTHDNPRSAAPSQPDPTPVEDHLVVDKTDWVPGTHPDEHRRWDGQTAYRDRYFRCIRCGAERASKADLPDECTPGGE